MDMFIMCQIPLYVVFASSTNGGVIWASNKLHNWKSFSYLLLNVVIIYIIYIYIYKREFSFIDSIGEFTIPICSIFAEYLAIKLTSGANVLFG